MDCACTALKKSVRMHGALLANTAGFLGEGVGLLNKEEVLTEGYSRELADNTLVRDKQKKEVENRDNGIFKVAVTSRGGKLVDQHFGKATTFMIFAIEGQDCKFLETRSTKKYCNGGRGVDVEPLEKNETIKSISDCDAVLTMKIGSGAQKKLQEYGIDCVEYCYTIECGLKYLQMVGKQRNRYKI
ncbi:NifB/NifX family molybdenum-iron cluster-binding protein [Methanosarcina sp. T3]|uniref:NifB/NifX family molybdenum-iron cluster-binding protein n=1 Tax=Methanosarcina sp. T3 TaxID=3439062 RepID=UPI003F8471EC